MMIVELGWIVQHSGETWIKYQQSKACSGNLSPPELVITKEQQSAKIVLLRFKILKSENEFIFLENLDKIIE